MKKIAIYGAGGFGREVKQLINHINIQKVTYELIGFFDDGVNKGKRIDELEVLGGINELNTYQDLSVVLCFGNPQVKEKIIAKLNPNFDFPNLIHPNVVIYDYSLNFGKGIIVCANCFVSLNVCIGDFVSVNVNTTIGHDVKIGENCSIMPGVNISGNVNIGANSFVGVGAKLLNDISISHDVTIGAGSVVLKNVEIPCTVFGNPARVILNK